MIDNKRVYPRLEVDHHQQVHERDREDQADAQSQERRVHALYLPANFQRVTALKFFAERLNSLVHVACYAAQIPVLRVAVHIENRQNVVMVDNLRRLRVLEVGPGWTAVVSAAHWPM